MGTLLVLVVFAALFLLFAEEASALCKKWYGVYWIRVTVPLLVISFMWVWNDESIPLILEWLRTQFVALISEPASWLPGSLQWLGNVFGLFLLTSLPPWILFWKFSRNIVTESQTQMIANVYAASWVFFAVLLLV